MLNFANPTSNVVADNKVSFCGIEYLLTDKEATQLKSILDGMVSTRSIGGVSQNTLNPVVVNTPVETPKTKYVATKDFKPKYAVKEQTATDGTKLFCISRDNGWTRAEKSCMNKAIKALKGIKEIEVSYEKDGKTRTFKAWGYNTESTAKKHLKELPTVITVAQLNNEEV